jgi:hypothetical protein
MSAAGVGLAILSGFQFSNRKEKTMANDYFQQVANMAMNNQLNAYSAALGAGCGGSYRQDLRSVLTELLTEKAFLAEYRRLGFRVPKGMTEKIAGLERTAVLQYKAEMELELAAARRQVEELRGRQEKLTEAQEKVRELEAALKAP